jgi:hypothetical protein
MRLSFVAVGPVIVTMKPVGFGGFRIARMRSNFLSMRSTVRCK